MLSLQAKINKDLHKEVEALVVSRGFDKREMQQQIQDYERLAAKRLEVPRLSSPPYIPLYTPIYPYIPLYTPIYPYIPLYTSIYPYIPLYTPIYPYIPLYTMKVVYAYQDAEVRDETVHGRIRVILLCRNLPHLACHSIVCRACQIPHMWGCRAICCYSIKTIYV